jgi:NADH dehydrogenase
MNRLPHETLPPTALLASRRQAQQRHRILIVGGGAGGLELAARLGRTAGRRGEAEIVLVDAAAAHLWKPLLHEIAAGTRYRQQHELDYRQQARLHGFRFHQGRLQSVERGPHRIWLAALCDDEGMEIAPRRSVAYDTLVLAVGGTDNDFGTPGARRHALSLNSPDDAEHFHRRLMALCARADLGTGRPVQVAIVGGGATGVELAAELCTAAPDIAAYGLRLQKLAQPLQLTLVEAGPRLLAALPEAVAERARQDLEQRGVTLRLGQQVAEVHRDALLLRDGSRIDADLVVWAAGVQGAEVLAQTDGLDLTPQRQLKVGPTLQTLRDEDVFALGDCASCRPDPDAPPVPPKAQAAHQQAALLAESLQRRLRGESLPDFHYRERGNLVTLGRDHAVGALNAGGGGTIFGGAAARFGYWLLHRRHLAVLLGPLRTAALTLGECLSRRARPRVKLH